LTRLERLARDKHSSLFRTIVNYGRKKFNNLGPRTVIDGTLAIYQQLLGLKFVQCCDDIDRWHHEVQLVSVFGNYVQVFWGTGLLNLGTIVTFWGLDYVFCGLDYLFWELYSSFGDQIIYFRNYIKVLQTRVYIIGTMFKVWG
jgi:hypothetical protein